MLSSDLLWWIEWASAAQTAPQLTWGTVAKGPSLTSSRNRIASVTAPAPPLDDQPDRHFSLDLHLRQTRSPAQALGNDWRHMRQCLILASDPNSGRVDLCLDRIRTPRHGPRNVRRMRMDGYGGVSVDPPPAVGRRNRTDAAEALPLTDGYVCPGSANSRADMPIRWGLDARQKPSGEAGSAR